MITDTGDTFCDHDGCSNYSDWEDGWEGWTKVGNKDYRPDHRRNQNDSSVIGKGVVDLPDND